MPAAPPDEAPFSDDDLQALFAPLELHCGGAADRPGAIVAVSGGSDSLGLLLLLRRWRDARRAAALRELPLVAVTVDHGLRPQAAQEARAVGALCRDFGVAHVVRQWDGDKPESGVQEAAREARYGLLAEEARRRGFVAVLTAHTREDQAETFLMRLVRGSGLHGLAGMRLAATRGDIQIVRPLLGTGRARLRAELARAGVTWAEDPSNEDRRYLRPRLRAMLRLLAEEGLDAARLAEVAGKLARADAALEARVGRLLERHARIEEVRAGPDGARETVVLEPLWFTSNAVDFAPQRALAPGSVRSVSFGREALAGEPPEIGMRLLARAIAIAAPAIYPPQDAQLARLLDALRRGEPRRNLAGALVSVQGGVVRISQEPPRRARRRQ